MKSNRIMPLLAAMMWAPWPMGTPRENPWGPPSAKPEHLRDEEDLRKLRMAQERRARKAKK